MNNLFIPDSSTMIELSVIRARCIAKSISLQSLIPSKLMSSKELLNSLRDQLNSNFVLFSKLNVILQGHRA